MDNYDILIRRYINLHDNAFHLTAQLSEVNKVLFNIEEVLKTSLNGKKFTDKMGNSGYIMAAKDTGSGREANHHVQLVYDDNSITQVSLNSLKNFRIYE
ncbi:hypothetical protein [Peribacillus sp. SCS-37]|uniref:hypothetical protein n=1 Tax=Paraperibacillus esterisolvens TaxID=3115296 RepID=UPI0039069B7E